MSELDEQESEFTRLLARAPFDETSDDAHRDALRERVLSSFASSPSAAPPAPWKLALYQGQNLMRRPVVRYGVLAACLLVAAVWLFAPGQQSSAEAFHKFATAIVEARSAKFQSEVSIEGQPKQTFQSYYLAPGRFRQELGAVVNVMDMKLGQIVTINPAMKTVTVMNMQGRQEKGPAAAMDFFEQMRDLLAQQDNANGQTYQRLGEKEIDGQRALGFRLQYPGGIITLWGNPLTGQPVRVETVFSGVPRTEVAMTDFDFKVELPESLFDVTPPASYKVRSFEVDASPFTETDLVNAFQACGELADGEFPETLDTGSVNRLIAKFALGRDQDQSPDDRMNALMKQSMTLGRGFGFALQLPKSADPHYAGKGVKLGAQDTPIFWYKPADAQAYRVIYADLSVRDVAAQDLPQDGPPPLYEIPPATDKSRADKPQNDKSRDNKPPKVEPQQDTPRENGLSARQILDRMHRVYADCKSYRDSGVVKTVTIKQPENHTTEITFTTAFVRPDRFRFEFQSMVGDQPQRFLIASDENGIQSWWDLKPGIETPQSLQFALGGAAGVSMGASTAIPPLLFPAAGGGILTALTPEKRIADEKLDTVDCFRVQGLFARNPVIVWIDKQSYLVRRIDQQLTGEGFRAEITTTYQATIDEPLSDQLLRFDPPAAK